MSVKDNTDELQQKIDAAIAYGTSLVGVPYAWWIPHPDIKLMSISYVGSPFYRDKKKDMEYSNDYIMQHGINCAGILNLMAQKIGVEPLGGVIMWTGMNTSNLEIFNSSNTAVYTKGTLLLREYKSIDDQGHIAIVVDNGMILHAYPNSSEPTEDLVGPGVVIEPISTSLKWSTDSTPFYDYVLKPEHWITLKH